jgi:cytochrome P450
MKQHLMRSHGHFISSQHPSADDRLYAELSSVLGEKDAKRIPTVEDIPKLEYTEKVFRESMRLYPPAWSLGRQVINDYKIDKCMQCFKN